MKFCRDCAHFHEGLGLWCRSPKNKVNPVTGLPKVIWAHEARAGGDSDGKCGPNAMHFQPKAEEQPKKKRQWWALGDQQEGVK